MESIFTFSLLNNEFWPDAKSCHFLVNIINRVFLCSCKCAKANQSGSVSHRRNYRCLSLSQPVVPVYTMGHVGGAADFSQRPAQQLPCFSPSDVCSEWLGWTCTSLIRPFTLPLFFFFLLRLLHTCKHKHIYTCTLQT